MHNRKKKFCRKTSVTLCSLRKTKSKKFLGNFHLLFCPKCLEVSKNIWTM